MVQTTCMTTQQKEKEMRTYKIIGSRTTIEVQVSRLPGGGMELNTVDHTGKPLQPRPISTDTWEDTAHWIGNLVEQAIKAGQL